MSFEPHVVEPDLAAEVSLGLPRGLAPEAYRDEADAGRDLHLRLERHPVTRRPANGRRLGQPLLDCPRHDDLNLQPRARREVLGPGDRKSTRLNSSHITISYAV